MCGVCITDKSRKIRVRCGLLGYISNFLINSKTYPVKGFIDINGSFKSAEWKQNGKHKNNPDYDIVEII